MNETHTFSVTVTFPVPVLEDSAARLIHDRLIGSVGEHRAGYGLVPIVDVEVKRID